jgi:hypothetical protein
MWSCLTFNSPAFYHALYLCSHYSWGRDSSVGIATINGLDGSGIESQLGRDFSHPSRQALGPTHLPIQWIPTLLPGCWSYVKHAIPSSAEVKERVELFLFCLSGPLWPALKRTLRSCTLTLTVLILYCDHLRMQRVQNWLLQWKNSVFSVRYEQDLYLKYRLTPYARI